MNYKLTINFSSKDLRIISSADEWILLEQYPKNDRGKKICLNVLKPLQTTVFEWTDQWYLYMSSDTDSPQPAVNGHTDTVLEKNGIYILDDNGLFVKQGTLDNPSCFCEVRNRCSAFPMLLFGLAVPKDQTGNSFLPVTGQCVPYNQKMQIRLPDTVELFLSTQNNCTPKKVQSDSLYLDCSTSTEWTVTYDGKQGCFLLDH